MQQIEIWRSPEGTVCLQFGDRIIEMDCGQALEIALALQETVDDIHEAMLDDQTLN